MSELDGAWQRAVVSRTGSVTEVRLHSDGGPLVWDAVAHRELPQLFQAVGNDETTKVVVLTGTGDAFCRSMDLTSFQSSTRGWDEVWLEGTRLLEQLLDLRVPVISAVNGPALVHAEIPLLADVVLAAESTVFADKAHLTRGTPPGDGVHLVWLGLLGPNRGRAFLLTGEELDAREAHRLGVVAAVTSDDDVLTRAHQLAAQLAGLSRPTLLYTKAAINITLRRLFSEGLSHGLALQGLAYYARGGAIEPGAR